MNGMTVLTNTEIDRKCAELMGWKKGEKYLVNNDGGGVLLITGETRAETWHPSTDLNQAWQVVDRLAESGWYLMLYGTEGIYTAYFRKPDKDMVIRESAMSKPTKDVNRAICLAALQAWEEK